MKSTFEISDTSLVFSNKDEEFNQSNEYIHYELFKKCMSFLGSIGFYVSEDKEIKKQFPNLLKDRKKGRYADLKFKAERYPKGFKIVFYQDVVTVNSHGGYYDFDKLAKMPYLVKKQYEFTVRKLLDFLKSQGYADESKPLYKNAEDKIKQNYISSWHHPQKNMNFSLSSIDGTTSEISYNNKDRDNKIIYNGDIKYYRDYNGYLCRGKVYHNINNMWWIIVNKHLLHNKASFELFDLTDNEIAVRRKKKEKVPQEYIIRKKELALASNKELINELKRRGIKTKL